MKKLINILRERIKNHPMTNHPIWWGSGLIAIISGLGLVISNFWLLLIALASTTVFFMYPRFVAK